MRKDWEIKKLGDVCTLQRGFYLPKRLRKKGKYPLMSSSGCIDSHVEPKVSNPGVITGRSSSIGSVFFIDKDFWPLNTTLYVKDFHGNDPRFISYLLSKFDLSLFSSGAGVPTLNRNSVHGEPVYVPIKISEQKQIVAILDEVFEGVDRAIANTEKNLTNTRELLQSYLNDIFRQGDSFPSVKIGDIGEVFDGPHATPKTIDYGPIFLGISSLQDGIIRLEKTRHVSPEDFKKWTRRVEPRADDIVFSYETRLGQAAIIPEELKCCLGRRMGLVRFDKTKVEPRHFLYLYLSPPYRKFLDEKTIRGATVDRISIKEFPAFPISLPDMEEQKQMVYKIESFSRQIQHLQGIYQRKLEALAELKQSILQKAFSGELTADTVMKEVEGAILA